jgi:hypothetical protein
VNSWKSNIKHSLTLLTFGRIALGRANDIEPIRANTPEQCRRHFSGLAGKIKAERRIFEIRAGLKKLQVITCVRQIKTFVHQRKIGHDVFQNGVVESRPIGK